MQAGRGRVNGRPIVCYAQDSRVAGGSVGTAEAESIVQALRRARRLNAPVFASSNRPAHACRRGPQG